MNINLYSLGLMSGTSLDGIDVSIIKSNGEQYLEIIDDSYLKYEDQPVSYTHLTLPTILLV